MIFVVLILIFLWTFQVLFLNKYYEWVKNKDIKEVAEKISKAKNNEELQRIVNNSVYDKNICVEITNDNNSIYKSNYLSRGCLDGKEKVFYKEEFIESNKDKDSFELINPRFNNKTLVYALKLDSNLYAFVNTSLDPIDSTVTILKDQLIYVSIVVLILSFLVAYFISKHISNPIVKINKAARQIAKKDFNVVFDPEADIDEINELAKTLNYARDELQKTDELRRDLMANVSHDLKTPLTMIKAYAEMARDLNKNNIRKRNDNLNVIIDEVDRLTILVNDILTLSSMESIIEKLDYSTFDLVELINNILKKYEYLKDLENYKFIFNCKDKIEIKADKKKLEQVIYNLINNAINYTGNDNKVMIKIINKDNIRVEITDTGKGIKKEDIPYIWDKYYKNKKKHKRNKIGTGLGLSIVKSILEQHKYNYGVTSKENKGTTFYFEIK